MATKNNVGRPQGKSDEVHTITSTMPSKTTCLFIIFALSATLVQASILENPNRVVAIGDVHGDLDRFLAVLKITNLVTVPAEDGTGISSDDPSLKAATSVWGESVPEWLRKQEDRVANVRWSGGDTVLVQTGDMLDRGPDTIAVYTLLKKLQAEAEQEGGAVVPLLGNHEIIRMYNPDFFPDIKDFDTFAINENHPIRNLEFVEEVFKNRLGAFEGTGFLGKWLRTLDTVKLVGDTIYSHAGILKEWANGRSLNQINDFMRENMGKDDWTAWDNLGDDDNPLWNRVYGMDPESTMCPKAEAALDMFGAERMVVGHTPDRGGEIRSKCGSKLIVIDVALSRGFRKMQKEERLAGLEILYHQKGTPVDGVIVNAVYVDKIVQLNND